MPKPRIRAPSLRRIPDPIVIKRDLGATLREADLLRSLLRLSERTQCHLKLIEPANPLAKESNI